MEIIALRGFVGDNGNIISIGDKVSVSDSFAKQLIKANKAKESVESIKIEPIKKSKNINKKSNNVADKDDAHDKNNIVVNSDNNNIVDGDNVADIDTQNSDADVDINNNDEIIDNNTDNKLTDTNVGQLDNPKTEQQDNKNNSVIIQKNTAGKK